MRERIEDYIFLSSKEIEKLTKKDFTHAEYRHSCCMCGDTGNITYKKVYAPACDTPYLFICDECYNELPDK